MNFNFPYQNHKPQDLIRLCGYGEIYNSKTNERSYQRALARAGYPRFHVYLKEYDNYFQVSLHLDQKKPSYDGHAHAGEYEGELVENEARRITAQIAEIYGM